MMNESLPANGSNENRPPLGNPDLIAIIRQRIAEQNPITFAEYMDLALYHPVHGYYQSVHRRPGRVGDFITAPELHPFFGLTIARQVAECWDRLGKPVPFTIREYGSGIGGLAYDVIVGLLHGRPEIRPSLRYLLNEVNAHRTAQAMAAMEEVGFADIVDVDRHPAVPITGVVIANEVADALPVHRLIRRNRTIRELWVDWDTSRATFNEIEREPSPEVEALDLLSYFAAHDVDVDSWPDGARFECSPASASWIAEVSAGLARGYALIIDYGYPAVELYRDHRLQGMVRAYSRHIVTDDPYLLIGETDLTVHVDFTRLINAALDAGLVFAGLTTQSDALAQLGLGELLVDLQQQPNVGVDEYYRAQAAVFRLIDPAGLGRFRVLGLARNAPVEPSLRAFVASSLPKSLRF